MTDDFDAIAAGMSGPHEVFWDATVEGGPMDGCQVRVDIPSVPLLRDMRVYWCTGPTDQESVWHSYTFGQRFSDRGALTSLLTYAGPIDGEPPAGSEVRPAE